jgi:hypothetical protein
MAQYLSAVLGNHDQGRMLFGMPENGRMGDYVFNQEGVLMFFQFVTQDSGWSQTTYSSGSNNNTDNGGFEYEQARPCY